ncbi:putative phage abortive infection protein [Enterococcus casseliflavus]|uniref:putative phage abortive infection protein n=1 Tax=Enterococcus casseliflavus TaxID=37734 RepID=UPI003D6A9D90
MEFLKKNKKFIAWALIVTLIIIPLVIQGVINWDTMNNGSDDGWLGFWGGYLGSIIGVVGALIVIQIQLENEKKRFDEETKARDNEFIENKKRFDEETLARNKEFEESKKRFDEETKARNKEFEEEKKARKSEQIDNTFFNLLNLFISQQNALISEQNPERDIFENMLNDIREKSAHVYRQEGIERFYSRKLDLLSVINKAIKDSESFIEEKNSSLSEEEKHIIELVKKTWRFANKPIEISTKGLNDVYTEIQRLKHLKEFKMMIKERKFREMLPIKNNEGGIAQISSHIDCIFSLDKSGLLDEDSRVFLMDVDNDIKEYLKDRPDVELSPDKKRQVVEDSQEAYRKQLGSYFRIFHRIMKYLNENVNDKQIKKNYIGFLRANMNENQMAMIFYNINYTERGSGAIGELKGTGFFGEKIELNDLKSAHFFSPETLVWGKYDLKKMQEFC